VRAKDAKQLLLAGAFVVLAALSAAGLLGVPAAALGTSHLADPAREYLARSSEQSVRFLVVLSAAKTGLAVIEGSTANVSAVVFGASVQVGDVVKALYDAVDYAWTAVLFGCAILFALRHLLEAGFHVGQYTFAIALLTAAGVLVTGRSAVRMAIERVSRFAAVLTVVLWIAFPLSLILAAVTSAAVTAAPLQEAEREVGSLRSATSAPEDSSLGIPSIDRMRTYLVTKADDVTRALGMIMAGYALDCVVFPFVFGVCLIGLAKRAIGIA
jgi:hypothetical protein